MLVHVADTGVATQCVCGGCTASAPAACCRCVLPIALAWLSVLPVAGASPRVLPAANLTALPRRRAVDTVMATRHPEPVDEPLHWGDQEPWHLALVLEYHSPEVLD